MGIKNTQHQRAVAILKAAREVYPSKVHHEWQFVLFLREECNWGSQDAMIEARKIWLLEAVERAETVEDLTFILRDMIHGEAT